MLLQIRNYIRRAGMVSDQQLAREFRLDSQALQPMLDVWVAKGIIGKCQGKADCQSACFKCRVHSPVYYQYLASFLHVFYSSVLFFRAHFLKLG